MSHRNRPLVLTSRFLVATTALFRATPQSFSSTYLWWGTCPLRTPAWFCLTSLSAEVIPHFSLWQWQVCIFLKRWLNRFNSFCQHWRQRHFFEKNWCCACHLWIAICGCSSELKGSFQGLIFWFHYLYQATIVKGDDTVAPTGQRVCLQTINKLKWLRRTHGRLMANIMTIGHCTWTRCDYPCDKSFSRNCLLQDHQSHKKCLDASIQHPCQFCDAKFGTFLGLNEHPRRGRCEKRY